MSVLFTERFHRRVNWHPGSWPPPDRGSTLTGHLHPHDFPITGIQVCGHRFISIHFRELIL